MESEPELSLFISHEEITATVKKIAGQIRSDYAEKNPLLVGILKGSFLFLADMIRYMDFALEIDFIRLASYGKGTKSSGQITLVHDLPSEIKDRHVLIVEDIVDTGTTTALLIEYFQRKGPASVKLCALIDKPSRREVPISIDYLGFTIPNQFIVGYGMDWNEKFRNLQDIYLINIKE